MDQRSLREQAEEVLPDDEEELAARMNELQAEQDAWIQKIRDLSAQEKPREGIFFAAEIHEARQFKMMLEFKLEYCRAKLNRLRLGPDF
ncbi:hypothetical protein LJC48_03210 [Desulfovibrio sp. OttesenSCG-928-C06]|nr:hypothetical protein [Desulfovibrio sp. OttesenSCG-928-C06]